MNCLRLLPGLLVCTVIAVAGPALAQSARGGGGLQEFRAQVEALGLTTDQRQKLIELFQAHRGDLGTPEFGEAWQAVLTPEQLEKLKNMGAPGENEQSKPMPEFDKRLNIPYTERPGTDASATSLDLYVPAAPGPHPIMAYIHGGGWRKGDKSAVHEKPALFTGEGAVFASLNYRLIPEGKEGAAPCRRIDPDIDDYAAQMQDVAKGIAWLHAHAADFGGDPKRIYVIGHSAGAHLAALIATDERYLAAEGLGLDVLAGAIILDGGGMDIERQINEIGAETAKATYEGVFGKDPAPWKEASPITHVSAGKHIPPFLLIPIAMRTDTPEQARGLAKALDKAGVSAEVWKAEGKTHGSLNQEIGQSGDAPTEKILAFYHANEKNKAGNGAN